MKAKFMCDLKIADWAKYSKKNDLDLKPNSEYKVKFDYPLDKPNTLTLTTKKEGMSALDLLLTICQEYQRIYSEEEKYFEENPDGDEPPYGFWGHCIDDLYLEELEVNHKTKSIKLFVGS